MSAPVPPRVLTVQHMQNYGVTRARARTELRRGQWRRLAVGVLLTRPDEPRRADWVAVGLALAASGSAVTGWDALQARGLGGPRPPTELVRILTPAGARNRVVGMVHLRPSQRPLRVQSGLFGGLLPGLPIVTTARAIADTALDCHRLTYVRAMVTQAIQRGLCSTDEIAEELDQGPRRDSALLRYAMGDLRAGALSVAEAHAVELLLRRPGIPPFQVNAAIRDQRDQLIAVADVLWPHLRAVLEIDSREFHFSEVEWKQTMARHNRLTRLGYAVAHYPPSDLMARRDAWSAEVLSWLKARAAELGVPLCP